MRILDWRYARHDAEVIIQMPDAISASLC